VETDLHSENVAQLLMIFSDFVPFLVTSAAFSSEMIRNNSSNDDEYFTRFSLDFHS